MSPYWSEGGAAVHLGDALAVLRELPYASVDAVCTDPPYELGFMGREWDRRGIAFSPELWREVLRVVKPGAYLLSFGGTRTYHRMACAIEDAGWEIRDMVEWIYGSGFPKNAQVALKPAHEPICMARKPFRGSVAANVAKHGTGVLNIDASRVEGAKRPGAFSRAPKGGTVYAQDSYTQSAAYASDGIDPNPSGRWPANLVLSHAEGCRPVGTRRVRSLAAGSTRGSDAGNGMYGDGKGLNRPAAGQSIGHADADGLETVETWDCAMGCPVAELDRQSGASQSRQGAARTGRKGEGWGMTATGAEYSDQGGASRFFYVAKASAAERSAGLSPGDRNVHPCVKPLELMRYLCRLVTPPSGLVLDCFAGTGSTGCAAVLEGLRFLGIEQDEESIRTAIARIAFWAQHGYQPGLDLESAMD